MVSEVEGVTTAEPVIADAVSVLSGTTIDEADGVTTASDVEPVITDAVSVLLGTAVDEVEGVTTASDVEPVTVDAVSVLSGTAIDEADGVTTASDVEPVTVDAVSVLLVTAIDEADEVTATSEVKLVWKVEAMTVVPGRTTTEVRLAASLGCSKDFRDADEVTFGMLVELESFWVVFTGDPTVFVRVIVVKDATSGVDIGAPSFTF